MHRPFDGAFPADYPAELAIRQCTEVAQRLMGQQSKTARDRAYHMLLMAEDGLHSFDYDAGRQVYAEMEAGDIDEDAKRTVILKLHSDPNVGQLLLQRCGISSRWLTGNEARTLSRRLPTLRIPAGLHPQRGRTPGQQPRHLLHDRSRLPDTGTIRRSESEHHTIAAKSRVQRRDHRKRLGDVGRAAWRTPSAETK